MLSQAGQQLVDRLPVTFGDSPKGVGAVVKAVFASVVLVKGVAGGGIELDAKPLDEEEADSAGLGSASARLRTD
jgi:hypothetical protein